ncbi:MAG TPA: succinate dehydrogenase cytochrome b subunit [Paludibacter sp.]|nr:succinate dehydrogenase cytochrome b subunit [Paludibacter sp.]
MWLIDSSIGRKVIMSVTGVFLVLFLIFHSTVNFLVIVCPNAYNAMSGFLGTNWYAVIGTGVLAGGFVIHILYALYLSFLNMRARGPRGYAVTRNQDSVTWASQNMLVLGTIVAGFLALHLYQFWFKMQFSELMGAHAEVEPAVAVATLFSNWVYCAIYIVWLVALWFHLTHGVWSALQTLGVNNKTWLPRVKAVSNVLSTIVILLFISIPVYYLLA